MNIKEIKELIEIVDKSNLTGLEYENSGVKLVLKKEKNVVVSNETYIPNNNNLNLRKDYESSNAEQPAQATRLDEDSVEVKSPIVGTFYASPSPDSKPFAEVGDKLKKGEVLCIVEAMKLMNEITAEFDCEIVKVLTRNEELVQYGQPLFVVKPI